MVEFNQLVYKLNVEILSPKVVLLCIQPYYINEIMLTSVRFIHFPSFPPSNMQFQSVLYMVDSLWFIWRGSDARKTKSTKSSENE